MEGLRRRTIAVFDLDGTITRHDTLLAYLTGLVVRTPARWVRLMLLPAYAAAFTFRFRTNEWLKARLLRAMAGDLHAPTVERWTTTFVDGLVRSGLRRSALQCIDGHRARGDLTILATASPDVYVEPLAERLGIDAVVCTRTARDERGRLTGALATRNCYGQEKLKRVEALIGEERDAWHVIAYSDHHSDLPLLTWADGAVAVNPTARLRRLARRYGFHVVEWS